MEPVREVLDIPADPGGERAVLVVLVHRGEVTPFGIAGEQLDDAGFEVDAEPLPQEKEKGRARRRGLDSPAGPEPARGEKEGEEAGFEEHAVGLVAGEIAGGGDKGEEANEAEEETEARPDVEEGDDRGDEADPDDDHHGVGARGEPEESRGVPESRRASLARYGGKEVLRGEDAVGADEAFDLEIEGEKGGEVNSGEGAEKHPAGGKAIERAGAGVEEPANVVARGMLHEDP